MNTTPYNDFYELFLNKIMEDKDFFQYNNVSVDEAQSLAKERCKIYFLEAIEELCNECVPQVNFEDKDDNAEVLNFQATNAEKDLLANLMYEKYFEKDMSKLKLLQHYYANKELNIFSPANERKTFVDMFKFLQNQNKKRMKNYEAKDRTTGQYKGLEYSY